MLLSRLLRREKYNPEGEIFKYLTNGGRIQDKSEDMSWIIRLQNLPLSANASDIRHFFNGLKIPDGAVHIVGGLHGDAFIGFATDEDARQAMRFSNKFIHDNRINLLLSSRVEMDDIIAKTRLNKNATITQQFGNSTGSVYSGNNSYEQEFVNGDSSEVWGASNPSSWKNSSSVAQVIQWQQNPSALNLIEQNAAKSSSIYNQTRDERYSQYESGESFQGYTATVQPSANAFQPRVQMFHQPSSAAQQSAIVKPVNGQDLNNSAPKTTNPFAVSPPNNAPIFPPIAARMLDTENRYVELSNLPPNLLRPSLLESFLQPSQPLKLSSVKVVYDKKGFPLHSLVRFETSKDAANAFQRNGELGIRIRYCTKQAFDNAVDGSLQNPSRVDEESGGQSYLKDRAGHSNSNHSNRTSEFRDDLNSGRTTHMKRLQQRTPTKDIREKFPVKRFRDESQRFCIEFTNLPFRISETEIREFFGPRIQPTKVSRAYNEDGQASDRWILEFGDQDSAERAYRVKGKLQDRFMRARKITNEQADIFLAVPDKFGLQKKEEYERKYGAAENVLTLSAAVEDQNDHFIEDPGYGRGRGRGNFHQNFGGIRGRTVMGRGRFTNGSLFNGPSELLAMDERSDTRATMQNASSGNGTSTAFAPTSSLIRAPSYRNPRSNGPLIQGNPPRPPLIRPPSFFAPTPSSTIRQRGPPPANSRGSRPSSFLRGPFSSKRFDSSSSASFPTIVSLGNVPKSCSDEDIAAFLKLDSSKIAESAIDRSPKGTVFLNLGRAVDAQKAVSHNEQTIGAGVITVNVVTEQKMREVIENEVASLPKKVLDSDLINSVGKEGTVISCDGFPPNVTLLDVSEFFDSYSLVESSVRIKLDDNGVPTGECLLSLGSAEEATKAVANLDGLPLKGSNIALALVQAKK